MGGHDTSAEGSDELKLLSSTHGCDQIFSKLVSQEWWHVQEAEAGIKTRAKNLG